MQNLAEHRGWTVWRERMSATKRSDAGRRAGLWALTTLEEELGPDWPERARTVDDPAAGDLELAAVHAVAFAGLLEFALRLRLLEGTSGRGRIRSDLRRDVRGARRTHALLQLEVAALGNRLGYEASLECRQSRQQPPVDVVLRRRNERLAIETFVVRLDETMRTAMVYDAMVTERLRRIRFRHGVTFDGDLHGRLSMEGLQQWLEDLEALALQVATGGVEQTLDHPVGALRVLPEFAPDTTLRGPVASTDGQRRLATLLREKAAQALGAGANWLRVDVLDGLWQFSPWSRSSLAGKTESLADWVRSVLVDPGDLVGVVLSSGALQAQGEFFGESCRLDDETFGLRRLIESGRVRETVVVPISSHGAEEATLWVELYDSEDGWLDWALDRVGLGSLEDVLGHVAVG